ncbi:hypothetical protein KKF84_01425 [Myxococcota bacterium]|nr:hypothetical protein [Myxococcota bacterium]
MCDAVCSWYGVSISISGSSKASVEEEKSLEVFPDTVYNTRLPYSAEVGESTAMGASFTCTVVCICSP